jgi:hypothetical protein
LFNSGDGDIVNLAVFTFLEELEVDLTRTEDMSSDLFGCNERFGVGFR